MSQLTLFGVEPRIWSVSDLNRYIRQSLEGDYRLQGMWVAGEVSNLSRPGSGHVYFTLKDAEASLRCVMWRSEAIRQRFLPREGDGVEVYGRISVYEAGGQYQLYADAIRLAGEGLAFQEFLRLKARLEAEGLFDPARKRSLPAWPARIGVVTSPSGAALRDVAQVLRRRFRLADIILAPTPVQGPEAPAGIVRALEKLNRVCRPDVILMVRGGGSLEDLAAFNDEAVARAVAASAAPVVSGVGHETDFTIVDFVADARAPTPSAAAVAATPDQTQLQQRVNLARRSLARNLARCLEDLRADVGRKQLALRMLSPQARVAGARQRIDLWMQRSQTAMRARLSLQQTALQGLVQTLRAVGPESVLARGFAVVFEAERGAVVRSRRNVRGGLKLSIRVQDGAFPAVASEPGE
ncbi:MAG TPA: exodeoxyribonuclease VII large subunit [Anaerolineales bacterium]|nr:exodeoxyribonuclease VII large subunit [Anaerolineales bacterium]